MKILMLHNRYKIMGGEDVSTDAEFSLLKNNSVDIQSLYVNNDLIEKTNKLQLALNTIWSRNHYREIVNQIHTEKYDIVHVQNFFPVFSPSIFYAAKKAGARVVMSVRNYRLVCPNALMYVDNAICTECVGKKVPYHAINKKCYRESLSATSGTVAMLGIHNLIDTWRTKIDGLICISEFVKKQLQAGNFRDEQLYVKYNFVSTDLPPVFSPEDYYLYVGRISTEKGIDLLIDAFEKNGKKLIIIGDGPLRHLVTESASKFSNIIYVGKLPLQETYKMLAKAKALIFPSKWHEPFGRTIVEAFAHGTPVIGAALGGITELIQNAYNGMLFNPGIKESLVTAVNEFETIQDAHQMRKNAYNSYMKSFTPETSYKNIIDIYNKILKAPGN